MWFVKFNYVLKSDGFGTELMSGMINMGFQAIFIPLLALLFFSGHPTGKAYIFFESRRPNKIWLLIQNIKLWKYCLQCSQAWSICWVYIINCICGLHGQFQISENLNSCEYPVYTNLVQKRDFIYHSLITENSLWLWRKVEVSLGLVEQRLWGYPLQHLNWKILQFLLYIIITLWLCNYSVNIV